MFPITATLSTTLIIIIVIRNTVYFCVKDVDTLIEQSITLIEQSAILITVSYPTTAILAITDLTKKHFIHPSYSLIERHQLHLHSPLNNYPLKLVCCPKLASR